MLLATILTQLALSANLETNLLSRNSVENFAVSWMA
jgi:hypothetical protein